MKKLFLLIAILISPHVKAAEYFIAVDGSSGNNGLSTSAPWPFQHALDQSVAGDTLTLLSGLYTNFYTLYDRVGTAANPITIRSQTKWAAILCNSTNIGLDVWANGSVAQYVVIDGLCVSNSTGSGIKVQNKNCTIRNCWITHNGNISDAEGIESHSAINQLLEYNLVEYNGSGAGLGHGIYISGESNIVRGNVIRYNGAFGLQLYTGGGSIKQNENHFYSNLVYGNTNKYGITIYGRVDGGAAGTLGTNYVYGNTILDGLAPRFGGLWVTNNIILPSPFAPTLPINNTSGDPAVMLVDYNLSTNTISPTGPHDVITNYLGFVNTNSGLYWLNVNSPARSKALTTVFAPTNFFGQVQAAVSDIGAFQYDRFMEADTRVLDPSPASGADYWLYLGLGYGSGSVGTLYLR